MKSKAWFITLVLGLSLTLALLWLLSISSISVNAAPLSLPQGVTSSVITVCAGGGCDYSVIQNAVDAADTGDVIKVAAGTYTGVNVRSRNDITTTGVVTQIVYISKTITIQGGFSTTNWDTPDPAANPTILDAQAQGRVLYIAGVISPTIEGLRITGGDASDMGGEKTNPTDCGGGVYIWRALATISNNWVYSNIAETGGGLHISEKNFGWDKPGATIVGNTFFSNTAIYGGGIALSLSTANVSGNVLRGNDAETGGGLHTLFSRPTIQENIINFNNAHNGGGVYFQWSDPVFVNNVIADNHIEGGNGSGLLNRGGNPQLLHNTIARNTGGDETGVYTVHLEDWGLPTLSMTNTILVDQPVGLKASGISTITVNGILWYDVPITVTQSPTAVVTIQNQYTGDPIFAFDGYHIMTGSEAIDKGVESDVTVDIDNEPRPVGLGYDIGADEHWYRIYLPLVFLNN